MTEAEWLTATDPKAMLEYLAGRASGRKRILFGCACWRRLWHLLPRGPAREVVALAERDVDGRPQAGERELLEEEAFRELEAFQAATAVRSVNSLGARRAEVLDGLMRWCLDRARAVGVAIDTGQSAAHWAGQWAVAAESKAQCDLLREVFNPFRPVAVDPVWRRWNEGAVVKMAQAIYEERRFADLPILADALEEAGCDRADMVQHCRAGGEHVRGCWLVDLLLGKE
jgi:hypothetical protein